MAHVCCYILVLAPLGGRTPSVHYTALTLIHGIRIAIYCMSHSREIVTSETGQLLLQ